MSSSNPNVLETYFTGCVALLCLVYLGIEFVYIAQLPLVMDEFAGFGAVRRLLTETPYIDFKPYKTVLGYYLQLPALFLSEDLWDQMIRVKQMMAVVTSASIFVAAHLMRRHFSALPILCATLLLIGMSTFLERSAALRVDMLTSLFGLFSLIYLLDRRLLLSGVLAGLSFLVSQKGVFFVLCGGFALTTHWAFWLRTRRAFMECARFAAAALAPVALYFLFWSLGSSLETVTYEVVVKNQHIAFDDLYSIRDFWFQTMRRNPVFYGIALLAIMRMAWLRDRWAEASSRDWVLLSYSTALLGLCVWHKQPWPYFFVLLIPTAWILIAAFFDCSNLRWEGPARIALGLVLCLGVALPALRIPRVLERDQNFQKSNVSIARALLSEDESYLAGVSMIHDRAQTPRKLSWLDATRLGRIAAENPNEVIAQFESNPPKLLIANYRFQGLPSPVLGYLSSQYAPFVGNLMLYAPLFKAGQSEEKILFSGHYQVSGPPGAQPAIEGRTVTAGQRVWIERGLRRFESAHPFRIHLSPESVELPVDPKLRAKGILFDNVYGY